MGEGMNGDWPRGYLDHSRQVISIHFQESDLLRQPRGYSGVVVTQQHTGQDLLGRTEETRRESRDISGKEAGRPGDWSRQLETAQRLGSVQEALRAKHHQEEVSFARRPGQLKGATRLGISRAEEGWRSSADGGERRRRSRQEQQRLAVHWRPP